MVKLLMNSSCHKWNQPNVSQILFNFWLGVRTAMDCCLFFWFRFRPSLDGNWQPSFVSNLLKICQAEAQHVLFSSGWWLSSKIKIYSPYILHVFFFPIGCSLEFRCSGTTPSRRPSQHRKMQQFQRLQRSSSECLGLLFVQHMHRQRNQDIKKITPPWKTLKKPWKTTRFSTPEWKLQ